MKKVLFAAVALVAMASCATDEVVMRPENKLAIEFNNAFVENSTRAADINATNLANFGVYGSIKNANGDTGLTFDNTVVSKNGNTGAYEYSPAQVWASNATYTFVAFAPYTNAQWSYAVTNKQAYDGVITFNNEAAQANQDLLFAAEDRTTEVIDSKPEAVALTFNHMLSRVKFHFTNSFHAGSNVALKVTDVTITDAHSTGTLAVNDGQVGDWTVGTETFSRLFGNLNNTSLAENGGNGETEHFYLIPTEGEFNVTFKVRMTVAEGAYFDYTHNAVLKINMEKGHSYVVKTALNQTNTDPQGEMYAIEFKVEKVEDWEDFSDVNAELSKPVSTTAELAVAVAEGGAISLANNLTLTGTELNVAANKEVSLNLNGKTLTVNALDPIKNNGVMTITNGKVAAAYGENTRRCIYNYGEMTINGVEFVQTYDKKGAAINNVGKKIINNPTVDAVYYSIWNSGANAELIINGGTYTTTNNVALRDTWAYAVTCRDGAKMTINGGSFEGNHGVIAAEGGEVVLNGGTYHCTATYTGNSDWTLYAADGGSIRYNAAACTVTSANPSGATYGNVTTL